MRTNTLCYSYLPGLLFLFFLWLIQRWRFAVAARATGVVKAIGAADCAVTGPLLSQRICAPVSYTDLWSFGEINAEMRAERLLPLARVRLGGGALEA